MTFHILAASDMSADCFLDNHEECDDPTCLDTCHLPDRDDAPVWTDDEEMASWLDDDDRARRRDDR